MKALEITVWTIQRTYLMRSTGGSSWYFFTIIFFRNKTKVTHLQLKRREQLKVQIQNICDDGEQNLRRGKNHSDTSHEKELRPVKNTFSEIMKELGISSVSTTAKKEYQKWKKGQNRNFLQQKFQTERPNQVWVSDITIFKFSDKYYYLCAIIDLFSRKIISYRISQSSSTQLLPKTFRQAYSERKTETGLMFHSDRGGAVYFLYVCAFIGDTWS